MKTIVGDKHKASSYMFALACSGVALALLAGTANAQVTSNFWDNNGLATPSSGVWDTSTPNWTSSSTLTASPTVFTNGSFAEFAAGTTNLATLNINVVDNTVTFAGLATGFSGFTGATVTNATFSGAGSLGLVSGLQGLICPSNGSLVFNVALTGAGGVEPEGGSVTLNATNTFTGNSATGSGSTLTIGSSGSLGSGAFTGTLANAGAFVYNSTNAQTMSGAISGAGVLTNIGSGTLTLNATNTFTGSMTIGSGATLIVGPTGELGSLNYTNTITNNGTFVFSGTSTAAQNLGGLISGNGTFNALNCTPTNGTVQAPGQVSLITAGGNTYTGITTISNAYVLITNDNGLGTPPASLVTNQLTFNVGLNGDVYGLRLQSHSTTLSATRGIYLGTNGSGVIGGAVNVQAGNTLTIAGPICGPGSFSAGCNASFGNGTVVVSNASNTYAGSTYITDGTLQLGLSGALPSGTPLNIYSTAGAAPTLNLNGFSQTIGPLQNITPQGGTGSVASAIKLTGALTVLQTNVATSFGGVISGAGGSLTINTAVGGTPGTLTLTGADTYTGPTIINGATLALSGSGTIGSTASIFIGAGGTFDVSAFSSSTYSFPSLASMPLTFAGTGTTVGTTAATIKGASGGVVDVSAQPVALRFTPTVFTGDSNHPALYIYQGTLNFNTNTIAFTNAAATALGGGTYVVIQAPAITGAPATNVTVGGAGIVPGATASLSVSGGNVLLNVVSSAPPTRPTITAFSLSGTTLNISATNGTPNGNFVLLESTNAATHLSLWTPVLTNTFDASGNLHLSTNIVNSSNAVEFYSIQNP